MTPQERLDYLLAEVSTLAKAFRDAADALDLV